MWRASLLPKLNSTTCTYELRKQIFFEQTWGLVIVHHFLGLRVLFETGFKHVQRRVVPVVERILYVLSERNFQLSA